MRFVIVTGMSGAGKSTALKMLEDMGYFCVDNLPIPLLPGFVQMLQNTDTEMKKGTGCEKWTGSFRTEGKSGSNGS